MKLLGHEIRDGYFDGVMYTGKTSDVYKAGTQVASYTYFGRARAVLYVLTHFWR